MQLEKGGRGIGAGAALAGMVVIVIVLISGGYYLVTTLGPHPITGSYKENTTDGTYTEPTTESSTLSSSGSTSAPVGTTNSTTSGASSNSTLPTATQTNQTATTYSQTETYAPLQISMVVNQTILDQAQAFDECGSSLNCGSVIYIFNMTVTNTGTQTYAFNDLNLYLRTGAGTIYPTYTLVYAIQNPANGHPHLMPLADMQPGGRLTGEEGFEIPSNETPSLLTYIDQYAGVNASASIPAPSSWVSEVVSVGEASVAPSYLACSGSGNGGEAGCYTASFTGMNGSILGSSDYFTGEVMAFQITITLGAGEPIVSPGTTLVHSDVTQFVVVGETAPECIGGSSPCTNWTVDVYVVAQPGLSYFGDPALTVILQPT